MNRKYGWIKSHSTFKLKLYRDVLPSEVIPMEQLPAGVDLRSQCQPVLDQGQEGACSAFSITSAIMFLQPTFHPSEAFIYWNERVIENTTSTDSGAEITDGVQSVITTGVCAESDFPYVAGQFATQPPENCFVDAKKDVLSQYLQITNLQEMQSCLAQGYPFVFGFSVYSSFESEAVAQTGIVPIPSQTEECLGGHAVMACGYTTINGVQYFIVKNSWNSGWGAGGFFYLPFAYITNPTLASEFLTLRK